MQYLTITLALIIVILFGVWSRRQNQIKARKAETKKQKIAQKKVRRINNPLRRIK